MLMYGPWVRIPKGVLMTYEEIKKLCKIGKTGLVPGWKGYLKWNYALDEI